MSYYEVLDANSDALVKLCGEGSTVRALPVPASHARACGALRDGYYKIKRFEKLNAVAIRRLLDKFAASGQAAPAALHQAEAELEACTEAMQKISKRLSYNCDQLSSIEPFASEHEVPLEKGCLSEGPADGEEFYPPRDEIARFFESSNKLPLFLKDASIKQHDTNGNLDHGHFLGRLLHLTASLRSDSSDCINLILQDGPDLSVTSVRGETALYCATQSGSLPNVQSVAVHYLRSGESLDAAVPRTGWTPLMVACAKGHTEIAAYLLSSGADAQKVDVLGWTAREHAAYRGHLTTASLEGFAAVGKPCGQLIDRVNVPTKTAHKTLASGQKAVVVTLGTVQGGHDRETLKLQQQLVAGSDLGLESKFLEIIIDGADCSSKIVQLPLWEDPSIEPLVGRLDSNAQARVTVRLWDRDGPPAPGGARASFGRLESSGTVVLGEDAAKFGKSRESMLRETTVVMLDKETMEFSGTVLLSYVIATPFEGLDNREAASYKRQLGAPVRLVGHRGT